MASLLRSTLPPLPSGPPLSLLILGKTGSGKSATGNTIVEEEEYFESSGDSSSVTQVNKTCRKTVGGRRLMVLDTPGTIDTRNSKKALKEIAGAITESVEGYDAFVVIIKFGNRLTPEEKEAIAQVERLFGEDFGKHAVIVMAGGDTWKRQKKNKTRTFQEYLDEEFQSTSESSLNVLLRRFHGGCVLFNNFEDDEFKKRQQTIELIKKVDGIRQEQHNQKYNNFLFQFAKQKLEQEKQPRPVVETQVAQKIEESSGACFPGDTKVIKFPSISIEICNIIPGDLLLCTDSQGRPAYQEVYMLGHQDNESSMVVIKIQTSSKVLRASPGHYLPVNNGNYKLAGDICEGDEVNVLEGNMESRMEKVISVSTHFGTGKFNPFTFSGNLYVDGVLATCYEEHLRPEYAHRLMAIPRLVYQANSNVLDALNQKKINGVPWWAYNIMKKLE